MKIKSTFITIFQYEQKVFITLFAVFFIGFSFGSFYIGEHSNNDLIYFILSKKYIFDFYIKNIILFFLLSLSGFTLFALPSVFLCILFSGIHCSFLISNSIHIDNLAKSIILSLATFPVVLFVVTPNFFVSFSSLRNSCSLSNVYKNNTRYISPKLYLIPHIITTIFFLIFMITSFTLYNFVYLFILKFI